jgi:hypothetical protein
MTKLTISCHFHIPITNLLIPLTRRSDDDEHQPASYYCEVAGGSRDLITATVQKRYIP